MTMKHTEIPQNFDWSQLEWCDQLIFAQIKRFMNKDTRTCYPSVDKLKKLTQLSSTFIKDSIHRLEEFGLLKVTKRKGTSNIYYFPPETDQFEMFTEDFLDMDLPPKVKEYYMKVQKCLFNKDQEVSYTQYTDKELSEITNLSLPTVRKYNGILQEQGYMSTDITTYKDEAGFNIRQLNFDMQKLGQFGLWVKNITNQVTENTEDITSMKKKIEEYEKRIKSLEHYYHVDTNAKEVEFTKEYEF